MRRWLVLPLILGLLGGCSRWEASPAELVEESAAEEGHVESTRERIPLEMELYFPPEGQTPEEVVEAYFEESYWAYTTLVDVDLSPILHTDQTLINSSIIWSQKLVQRRRLLAEHSLCFVDTEPYPYSIRFIDEEELLDPRVEYWSDRRPTKEGDVTLHFVITGEEGRAYPPQMAVNTQHTMRLRNIAGQWKIYFLYFPGSFRKYLRSNNEEVLPDDVVLEALRQEFRITDNSSAPMVAGSYNGTAAAGYASSYTEKANPLFYHIGDWMGNCANFTSQSIWAGFLGEEYPNMQVGRIGMTPSWYAGEGGGSPAWENVEQFWQYITAGTEMRGQIVEGISAVKPGDLIQTSSLLQKPDDKEEEDAQPQDRFNHSLIVVDADTLLLAQNSPGCFVYYSDLPGLTIRIVRPHSIN